MLLLHKKNVMKNMKQETLYERDPWHRHDKTDKDTTTFKAAERTTVPATSLLLEVLDTRQSGGAATLDRGIFSMG